MVVRVLLFDFFGTLVDYDPGRRDQGFERTHQLLRSFGAAVTYDDFVGGFDACFTDFERATAMDHREFSMIEVTDHYLTSLLGRPMSRDAVDDVVETYLVEWSRGVRPIDGAADMLAALGRHHRLGVLSNTHHPSLVPGHLAAAGIADAFDVVVTSVDHGWRKPHPSVYVAALEAMSAHASETVFIGDTFDADYVGPRAAGMAALLIDPAERHDVDERHRLRHLLDVPAALAAIA